MPLKPTRRKRVMRHRHHHHGGIASLTTSWRGKKLQYVIPAGAILWILSTIIASKIGPTLRGGGSSVVSNYDDLPRRNLLRGGRKDRFWVHSDSQAFVSLIDACQKYCLIELVCVFP